MKFKSKKPAAVQDSFLQRRGGTILFFAGMALIGFLAQFQIVGVVLIAFYAISSLWRHIPVRITFIAALLALFMVPVAILAANWLVAQNFAAYAFLLFVWGVVMLTLDLKRELRPRK